MGARFSLSSQSGEGCTERRAGSTLRAWARRTKGQTKPLHEPQGLSSLSFHPLAIPPTSRSFARDSAATPPSPAVPSVRTHLFFHLFVTRFAGRGLKLASAHQIAKESPNALSLQDEKVGAPPREGPTPVAVASLGSREAPPPPPFGRHLTGPGAGLAGLEAVGGSPIS